MRIITCISILVFISFFYCAAQENQHVALTAEDSVRTMIAALPEVREKDNIYDSLTNRVQRIVIKVTSPDSAIHFYQVQAGYEGGTRFNPHFYFYVDLVNEVIYIEDLDHGDRTTLAEWRARRSVPNNEK